MHLEFKKGSETCHRKICIRNRPLKISPDPS